ncbi:MAG: TonB-dependent receptor plug domain-containing protein [Balneolaceae bacterium]
MKKLIITILAVVLMAGLMVPLSQSQNQQSQVEFLQLFRAIQQDLPRERIYVHTDRDWYISGDRLWMSAYVTSGASHQQSEISGVLYVEWIAPDGKVLERIPVRLEEGRGESSILIPERLRSGTYLLKAYTAWSLNFGSTYTFEKTIDVANLDRPFTAESIAGGAADIQFLPEGGHLIQGIESVVGVKAIGPDGFGKNVTGVVMNRSGDEVLRFSTEHLGMGSFRFTPREGQQYHAVIDGVEYELPTAQERGYVLQVSDQDDHFGTRVFASGVSPGESMMLFGHVRGEIYYAAPIELNENRGFAYLSKGMFPTGVVHLTLLDEQGGPVAERLVFNKNDTDSRPVEIAMEESYGQRDQVQIEFQIEGLPAGQKAATASVSVFDDGITGYKADSGSIISQFYLESDISGTVENPGFYFTDDYDASKELDLLMLTQGWRVYDMDQIREFEGVDLFSMPETGLVISGTAKSQFRRVPLENANVMIETGSGDEDDVVITETDENGRFYVSGFHFENDQVIRIKGTRENGSDNVHIEIDDQFGYLPENDRQPNSHKYSLLVESHMGEAVIEVLDKRAESAQERAEEFIEFQMSGELEEVVVTGERTPLWNSNMDFITSVPPNWEINLMKDAHLGTLPLSSLLNQLLGVRVDAQNQIRVQTGTSSFRGDSTPLIYVDGVPVDQQEFLLMSAFDVLTISVYRRGADLAIFGTEAAGGVLVIRTRSGEGIPPSDLNVSRTIFAGYQSSVNFYSPEYGTMVSRDHEQPDERITLYWDGMLNVEDGVADVSFFTNDLPSTYRVVVEGVTEQGRPFYQTKTFTTNSPGISLLNK